MRATSRWTGLPASVRGVDTRPLRPAGVLPCAVNVIDRTVLGICSHAGREVSQIASPSVRTPVPLPASGTTVIEMTRSLNTPGIDPKLNASSLAPGGRCFSTYVKTSCGFRAVVHQPRSRPA